MIEFVASFPSGIVSSALKPEHYIPWFFQLICSFHGPSMFCCTCWVGRRHMQFVTTKTYVETFRICNGILYCQFLAVRCQYMRNEPLDLVYGYLWNRIRICRLCCCKYRIETISSYFQDKLLLDVYQYSVKILKHTEQHFHWNTSTELAIF